MNYQVVPVFRKVKQFSHCVPYNSFKRENHKINIFFLQQSHNGLSSLVDDQPVSSNLKKACYYFKKKKKHSALFVKPIPFLRFVFLGLFVISFQFFYQLLTWHVLSLKTKLNWLFAELQKHVHKKWIFTSIYAFYNCFRSQIFFFLFFEFYLTVKLKFLGLFFAFTIIS